MILHGWVSRDFFGSARPRSVTCPISMAERLEFQVAYCSYECQRQHWPVRSFRAADSMPGVVESWGIFAVMPPFRRSCHSVCLDVPRLHTAKAHRTSCNRSCRPSQHHVVKATREDTVSLHLPVQIEHRRSRVALAIELRSFLDNLEMSFETCTGTSSMQLFAHCARLSPRANSVQEHGPS